MRKEMNSTVSFIMRHSGAKQPPKRSSQNVLNNFDLTATVFHKEPSGAIHPRHRNWHMKAQSIGEMVPGTAFDESRNFLSLPADHSASQNESC